MKQLQKVNSHEYEIISRMFDGLLKEIEELKKILFQDLSVTEKSKEKG